MSALTPEPTPSLGPEPAPVKLPPKSKTYRVVGIFQILLSGVLGVSALATVINMVFIFMRPDTVSVVNAMMGQSVMIIFLVLWSRIFFVKGSERVRPPR